MKKRQAEIYADNGETGRQKEKHRAR